MEPTQISPGHRAVASDDRRRAVERVLTEFETTQREAVCLCLLAGKTTAEVAEITGRSRAQVARLVRTGLERFARERATSLGA